MTWRTDIENTPRGSYRVVHRQFGKSKSETKFFVPDPVILATKCGKVVRSHWVPPIPTDHHDKKQEGHWECLHYGERPVAWQPWPEHPHSSRRLLLAADEPGADPAHPSAPGAIPAGAA